MLNYAENKKPEINIPYFDIDSLVNLQKLLL